MLMLYNPCPTALARSEGAAHRMQAAPPASSQSDDYGLRRGILSPMETLAQSVSTMAPTTTPAATIPLVCALAGNGTWLAYVLDTVAIFLVGLCICTICPSFGLSRIALHLCIDDLTGVAFRDGRVEPFARLCGYGIKRDWRLLSLCQPVVAGCHRAHFLCGFVVVSRHRSFDLDCLSRREDFRAPHAVD